MNPHSDAIRAQLAQGPLPARQLLELMGVSQPTLWRAIKAMDKEIVRLGAPGPNTSALCPACPKA